MATCDVCGESENMPYHCQHCGGTFCGEHRLPESHDCPGLEDWNDPSGIFDSGFDDSVNTRGGQSSGRLSGVLDTGTGGPLGYFRNNMTFVFLGLMFITFGFQYIVFPLLGVPTGSPLWRAVFVISPEHPFYLWTWVTSIFAHAGLVHILFNAIVIYFFGRLVEQYVGSRNFTLLFVGSGVLAGLGHIAFELVQGGVLTGALGASGAALAVMGVLTVLNPGLRVYLYFLIPVPIWVITAGYAFVSISGLLGVPILPGVANAAHLAGLVVGLAYGQHVKGQQQVPNQLQFGGRGGGGMGGPGRGRGPF